MHSNKERARWVSALGNIGITKNRVISMPESEFQSACQFCLEAGFKPDETPEQIIVAQDDKKTSKEKPKESPAPKNWGNHKKTEDKNDGFLNIAVKPKPIIKHKPAVDEKPIEKPKPIIKPKPTVEEEPIEKPKPIVKPKSAEKKDKTTEKLHSKHSLKQEEIPKENPWISPLSKKKTVPDKPKEQVSPAPKREVLMPKEEVKKHDHNQKAPEEKKVVKKSHIKLTPKQQILEDASRLKPEPKEGPLICFTFPDGKRVKRRFSVKTKGLDLMIFVASQDCMFTPQDVPIKFSLQQTLGPYVDTSKSLESQGITRNTMICVVLDD